MPTVEAVPVNATQSRQTKTNHLLREAQHASPPERQRLIDEVIVANIEVARSIARKYRNRGIATEDLEQVACVALVRAAGHFDPSKADDFLSYAVPTIRGEVRRYFRDQGWMVRPPRGIQELQSAIHRLSAGTGHEASDDDVAAQLGVTAREVRAARSAQGCFAPTSLDVAVRDGGDPLGATLVSDEYDEFDGVEARVFLDTLTRDLKPRERLVLYLRFVEGLTQSEIGAEIGVTQMQVSRILAKLLAKMRERAGVGEQGTEAAS
jgi:RNA polymerase sigma-B factor